MNNYLNNKISNNTQMKKNESNLRESSSNLGVWTFIAFIIAYNAGRWWWLLAIILGLAIIMDNYVGNLCEAIVPYPDIISIH